MEPDGSPGDPIPESIDWDELLERLDAAGAGDEADGEWVSLGEAASGGAVSVPTLRSWYRSGKIRSRMVLGPHGPERRVPMDDVIEQAQRSARLARRVDQERSADYLVSWLLRRVAALEAHLGVEPAD